MVDTVAPPLYSTFAAVSELFVTAAVLWFFYHALRHGTYRWPVMLVAVLYEIFFNITYMVSRLYSSGGPATEYHGWFIAFLGFHGSISLLMFLGLIGYMLWAFDRYVKVEANPIGENPRLAYWFIALWMVSIASGEAIYLLMWTDLPYA